MENLILFSKTTTMEIDVQEFPRLERADRYRATLQVDKENWLFSWATSPEQAMKDVFSRYVDSVDIFEPEVIG